MRERKNWNSLNAQQTVSVPSTNLNQELLTAKEQAIRTAVANLNPVTTFSAIGEQIAYSRQWVSKHMQERFKSDSSAMWKKGDDWRIPVKTAEIFIREFFDA